MALTQISTKGIKDGTISSADLSDQSVTLDKLPHGTSSNDGKFLRANNGADPSFETVTVATATGNANVIQTTDGSGALLQVTLLLFLEMFLQVTIYPLHEILVMLNLLLELLEVQQT